MVLKQPRAESSYNYKVVTCPTPKELQKQLKKHKDIAGVYFYYIPQATGCLLNIATPNPKAIQLRTAPKVVLGMKPLTENEAKKLIMKCEYLGNQDQQNGADNFLTWAYENSFEVIRKVKEQKK